MLVVDDTPPNITAMEAVLDDPKINLIKAASGNEALAALLDNEIALVLLDVQMPEMDGFEVAELMRAKEATRSIPIIFVTAINKEEQYVFKGYALGAVDYLFKPIDADVLRCKVNVFIRLHTQRAIIKEKVAELEEANKELGVFAATRENQLQIKDQFLSHVSHELRTPLTAIHQFVTILLDGLAGEINAEQREYLAIVLKNAGQLKHMIGDLLEITRETSGKLTVDLRRIFITEVVTDALHTLEKIAAEKNISLQAEITPDLPAVYADPARILQILTNLIENGVKFTPEKGAITLRAELFNEDPAFICLEVRDTGCGIAPEDTKAIFHRLYQSETTIENSRAGLGLGLHICKTLVERQGGRIWLTSRKGEGSSFFFTLPLYSLDGMLLPVLKDGRLRELSIITIDVMAPEEGLDPKTSLDNILTEVLRLLNRCIHPYEDKDFILPGMGCTENGETFSIVAGTDITGTLAIKKRITERLRDSDELKDIGLRISISHRIIHIGTLEENKTMEGIIKDTALKIEEFVEKELAKRRT